MKKRFKRLIPVSLVLAFGISFQVNSVFAETLPSPAGANPNSIAPTAAATPATSYNDIFSDIVNSLPKSTKGEVLAEVNGQAITAADLANTVVPALRQQMGAMKPALLKQIVAAQSEGLNDLVEAKLFESEAKKRGISVQELLKQEVEQKTAPVTDAEIQSFYDQNKAKFGTKSFEEMKPEITVILKPQAEQKARTAFVDSLMQQAKIETYVEFVNRVQVGVGKSPSKGPANAPITIVEFTDYQCPFCSKAIPNLKQVMDVYKDQVRVVVRNFPLSFHQKAQKAAEAALCAHEQGKYWEYSDKLWASQSALDIPNLKSYAAGLGLDSAKFDTCLDSGQMEAEVKQDMKEGTAAGVRGTPAFFINGQMISGAQPFEEFKKIIDAELRAAKLKGK